ncbi:uncharacterized protein LOC120981017 isoform X2 [Bufo bufo]|uniref:uncharacterized protein LOC120981017 isoform X2 n=1 Tax=Bufo bufo TaxID=8384 RepID=UPI001ABE9D2A|nr:uncharacterized protein LOC120981017 isoform X2 [Bufo bufo]
MEELLRKLIQRAESSGGEAWLQRCLADGVSVEDEEAGLQDVAVRSDVTGQATASGSSSRGASHSAEARVSKRIKRPRRAYSPAEARSRKGGNVRSSPRCAVSQPGVLSRAQLPASSAPSMDPGPENGPEEMVIWILGHSFVFWAERRAAERNYLQKSFIGAFFVSIVWLGFRGLKWYQIIPILKNELRSLPQPDVLIIHAGGNDLGKIKTLDLMEHMKSDLFQIKSLIPEVILIFSEIIPRLIWKSDQYGFMEKIRKRVNRSLEKFLPSLNGWSIRHTELEGFIAGLYRNDLVHLSDIGLDIFNSGLQDMIDKAVVFRGGHVG